MQKLLDLVRLKTLTLFVVCLLPAMALAQLPPALQKALERSGIPAEDVSVWISPAGSNEALVEHRAQHPVQPASTVKIVTTLAALDLLKPDYVWTTQIRAQEPVDSRGIVRSVSIIGGGDPHLMIEQLWLMVEKLRQIGVRRIEGDITADRSAFGEPAVDPSSFDGASERAYNVGADAALVNFQAVSITLEPQENGKWANVTSLPVLESFSVPRRVALSRETCADWKNSLKARFSDNGVRFEGSFPASCGVKSLHVSRWKANDYLTRVLRPMLSSAGIEWQGRVRDGIAGQKGVQLLRWESAPLPQIVSWINKYSNNTMARQLFLTLSRIDAEGENQPATLQRSRAVIQSWLEKAAGNLPQGTFIDNGSGLSRHTRISAETLGRVLNYGFVSGVMPEFTASLPLAGYDGTMRKRPVLDGSAHIKTGRIRHVRSIAGYVTDTQARRWSVVVLMNGRRLEQDRVFSQAVMQWCASGAAQSFAEAQRRKKAP